MKYVNEIHPSVDHTAIAAEQAKQRKAKLKRADKRLATRAVIASISILILALFAWLGWVIQPLAIFIEVGFMLWVAVWFGAWLQFTCAEGGLLNVRK